MHGHFFSTNAGCVGCHALGRHHLLNPKHLVVLSADPISHNSIHLLKIAADFAALSKFIRSVVFLIASFLMGVKSEDQFLLNYLMKSCPVFLW